jgi:hypothetical protein
MKMKMDASVSRQQATELNFAESDPTRQPSSYDHSSHVGSYNLQYSCSNIDHATHENRSLPTDAVSEESCQRQPEQSTRIWD